MEKQTTARFFRKPTQIVDLQDETHQYRRFQAELLAEKPFIASRTNLTGYDSETGCFRCLLVTSRKSLDGILVDSEGYHYARYAAYVKDKRTLDLKGVARDELDWPRRER